MNSNLPDQDHNIAILGLQSPELNIDHFSAKPGEGWCCIGANTSGVDSLCDILAGGCDELHYEQLHLPEHLGIVTFAKQQALFEEELKKDDTDYMDRIDPGTPAISFITQPERHGDLIDACNMKASLHKGYRQLSSGQSRKLCLLAEATKEVAGLIVQSPYEGIDQGSCLDLNQLFATMLANNMLLIVTVNNVEDIPDWATHIAIIDAGELVVRGLAAEMLDRAKSMVTRSSIAVSSQELSQEKLAQEVPDKVLVRLKNGFGGYGDQKIFTGIDLTITEGDHTFISGPNGCGKSTLVHMITGDHPWCYTNDLKVFGIQRGTGESIWDIKRQMGIVSPELHRYHTVSGSCLQVLLSGLFDSIGVYRQPTSSQMKRAEQWLERLGMSDLKRQSFRQQTFARQRLLLIGRALIKVPRLLILDEPTQGLDQWNRNALLELLGEIAEEQLCTIVYVGHRPDEHRPFFRQHLNFADL